MLSQSFAVICAILLARNGMVSCSPQGANTPASLREPLLNIDMNELAENMNSPSNVEFYTLCAINEGRCNNIGRALKSLLWDPIPGQPLCYGCNDEQMKRVRYVIDTMKAKYPVHACKIRQTLGAHRPIFTDMKC
ncbi:uncharacterized protein [Palaemon carinicauda]|uniref:uncharacterized protein n=1 Tax=Palaemon carinicauda TaxID=392227 RepID=UPI0035B5DF64